MFFGIKLEKVINIVKAQKNDILSYLKLIKFDYFNKNSFVINEFYYLKTF